MTRFTILDCTTNRRVSPDLYSSREAANHDYYMNAGHTYIDIILLERFNPAVFGEAK